MAKDNKLVVTLPCAVGDTVYIISRGKVIPLIIDTIIINEHGISMKGRNEQYYGYGTVTLRADKTPIEWYNTQTEAEQKLAEKGVIYYDRE